MKLDQTSEWVKAIPGIIVIGFFIILGMKHSAGERRAKEMQMEKQVKEREAEAAAIQQEAALAEMAFAALPDLDKALNPLRNRYGWRELLETAGVYALHLQLLRDISNAEPNACLELPNMQARTLAMKNTG
jgi:hypothetical protein